MGAGCSSENTVKKVTVAERQETEGIDAYKKTETQYQRWLKLRKKEAESSPQKQKSGMTPSCIRTLRQSFPRAIATNLLVKECFSILEERGFTDDNTVFGSSVCPDDLRNSLVADMTEVWGENITLGGLGGFPFLGRSGFRMLLNSVPANGHAFVLFASHIGINSDGTVGKSHHMDTKGDVDCCASAIEALQRCQETTTKLSLSKSIQQLDFQHGYLCKCIMNEAEVFTTSQNMIAELPTVLYKHIRKFMLGLIPDDYQGQPIAFLGGIQINTPGGTQDQFVPLHFELRGQEVVEDLLPELEVMEQISHVMDCVGLPPQKV